MAINLTTLNTIGVATTDSASLTISLGENRTAAANAVYSLADFNAGASGDTGFSYDIQTGNGRGLFSIDAATGVLRYKGSLKHKEADGGGPAGDGAGGVYSLVVRARSKTNAATTSLETVVFKVGYDASNIGFKAATVSLSINEKDITRARPGSGLVSTPGANTDPDTSISYVLEAASGTKYYGYEQYMFSVDASGNVVTKNNLNYSYIYSQYNSIRAASDPNATSILQNFSITVKAIGKVTTRDAVGNNVTTTINISQAMTVNLGHVTDVLSWNVNGNATPSGALVVTETNKTNQQIGNFGANNTSNFGITYGLSGTDSTYFSVDSRGNLMFASAMDVENGHAANYSIVLFSGSNAGPDRNLISKAITLSLININDNLTQWTNTGHANGFSILENNAISGTAVATFLATDADGNGAGISYWLSGGNDSALFSIDTAGKLYAKQSFNYDTYDNAATRHGLYTVMVSALGTVGGAATNSTAGVAVTQMFVLSLGDADEFATTWVSASSGISIVSSKGAGFVLGEFNATDADGAGISYSLTTSPDAASQSALSHFTIVTNNIYNPSNNGHNATGTLKLVDSNIDATTQFLYSIVVHAKSGAGDLSSLFILSLEHVNGAQTLWSSDPATHPAGAMLNENKATGETVATFTPVDADGAGFSYWLTNGNDWAYFSIEKTTGILHVLSTFDYENSANLNHNERFTVIVNAIGTAAGNGQGAGATVLTQTFVLSIGDVDEFPLSWSGATSTTHPAGISLNETNAVGGTVATFVASDADFSGISYSLSGADSAYFSIVTTNNYGAGLSHTNGTGVLSFVSMLDYENGHGALYTVTINAHSGSGDVNSVFILSIGNANDLATAWSGTQPAGLVINEHNAGTNTTVAGDGTAGNRLATFTAVDADGPAINYTLSGNSANYFSIDSAGVLYARSSFDYESSPDHRFTVFVNAIGATGSTGVGAGTTGVTQTFILSLNDINEFAPNLVYGTAGSGVVTGSLTIGTNKIFMVPENPVGILALQGAPYPSDFVMPLSQFDYTTGSAYPGYRSQASDVLPAFANGVEVVMPFDLVLRNNATREGAVGGTAIRYGAARWVALVKDSVTGAITRVNGDDVSPGQASLTLRAGSIIVGLGLQTDDNAATGFGVGQFLWVNPRGAAGNPTKTPGIDVVIPQGTQTVTTTNARYPGGLVAAFTATDQDTYGGNISYSIVGGADAAKFKLFAGDINNNVPGNVSGTKVQYLYFVDTLSADNSGHSPLYSVIIDASSGGQDISQLFVMSIINGNNSPTLWNPNVETPRITTFDSATTYNVNSHVLASFSALDGDGTHISYWLAGDGAANHSQLSSHFSIDSAGNLYNLKNAADGQAYTVVVNAIGTDGAYSAGPGTIPLTQTFVVGSFFWSTTSAATVAVQAQADTTFILSITDNATTLYPGGVSYVVPFDIALPSRRDSGQDLNSANNHHYRYTTSDGVLHEIASDNNGSAILRAGTILRSFDHGYSSGIWGVYDPRDAFPGSTASYTGIPPRAVATFVANAAGDTINYSLGGADAASFKIDNNGVVTFISSLDQLNLNGHSRNYNVNIIATDTNKNVTKMQSFVVSIAGTADHATTWADGGHPSGLSLSENNVVNAVVTTFTAADVDGAAISYSLSGADLTYFSIESGTGILHLKSSLDAESSTHGLLYSLTVWGHGADGSGGVVANVSHVSQNFVLTVGDIDEFATTWSPNANSHPSMVGAPKLTGHTVTYAVGATLPVDFTIPLSATSGDDIGSYGNGVTITLPFDITITNPHNEYNSDTQFAFIKFADGTTTWVNGGFPSSITLRAGQQIAGFAWLNIIKLNGITSIENGPVVKVDAGTRTVSKTGGYVGLAYDTIVATFVASDADMGMITYGLSGDDAANFTIVVTTNGRNTTGVLHAINDLSPSHNSGNLSHTYSINIIAGSGDTTVVQAFTLSITTAPDHVDHASVWLDGTTATHAVNIANVLHDSSGHDNNATIQMHGMHYDTDVVTTSFDPATGLGTSTISHVVNNISDLESLKLSFNGYVDGNGATRNHWYFVQDDANDGTGHIVFDADGKDVQFNAGAINPNVSADQLNLLAGNLPSAPGQAWDGGFDPSQLTGTLALHIDPITHASTLTYDQFIALIGGDAGHITFV